MYDNAENNQAVVTCVTPPELEGTQLSEVDYTVACYQPEPITPETEDADPYLALIISLSIVGAVLLFALLSCVVYRSRIKPESGTLEWGLDKLKSLHTISLKFPYTRLSSIPKLRRIYRN